MPPNICNNCFKTANENINFIVLSCAHIFCTNCVNRSPSIICLICKVNSRAQMLGKILDKTPEVLYKYYKYSRQLAYTQDNVMFGFLYYQITAKLENSKRKNKENLKMLNDIKHENQEIEKRIKKMELYQHYYQKHYKEQLKDHERQLRPKTPTLNSSSIGVNSHASTITEDTISFFK